MLARTKRFIGRITGAVTAVVIACLVTIIPPKNVSAEGYSNEELKSMANQIAILVNEARIEHGLYPVYVVPYLNDMAQVRSRESIFNFSHTRADGSSFSSIIDTNLINYSFAAENLAAGSYDAQSTFEQWKGSERHWAAILNENITHMGVGCGYEQNSEYGMYWQITFVTTNDEYENQYLPTEYEIVPKAEGDLNGDATINSYDYLTITDYLRKKREGIPVYLNPAQLEAADCFRDGLITESDAKVMVRYILGEYKELPYVF